MTNRTRPIPTRRAALDLARQLLDEKRPCWTALLELGVPRTEVDGVIAAATRLYLQPVHDIRPTGLSAREWR